MSKIEGMTILGVRSFPPTHREVITFNTPLTLIVGYNGSGKTTIIECLKYATTGELPPNSKGGAFIHDPKLCGEKEVMAQVKLRFRSTGGDQFVVTRSLSLTMQRNKRTQKTLECSFSMMNGGDRNVVSSRTAEMDELVPRYLGVSSAVLDAVIFCHQDESLWPMSEPAALKKKFDEIFEALRYTKAIDNLKVVRKKKGEELAKLKIHEAQDKVNKEKGERNEKRCRVLSTEIQELRDKCDESTREMDEIQERIKEKREQATIVLGTVQELKNKKDQFQFRQDAVVELRDTIEEMHESDEFLDTSLSQYNERLQHMQEEIDQLHAQYAELQQHLSTSRRDLSIKQGEKGKLESDKEKYERQLQTRIDMIREAAGRHEIRGYDGDLSDDDVQAFYERMQKILNDKKRDFERLQRENGKELDKANVSISQLESRKAARTQDKVFARQRMATIDKKVTQHQNSISALDCDEGATAVLEATQNDLDGRYHKAQNDLAEAGWDAKIQQEDDRLRQLEGEAERLRLELVECTRRAADRAQLEVRKKDVAAGKRKLDTLINTWKDKLAGIIGAEWQPETVEAEFQSVLKQQNTNVSDARRIAEATQQELKQVDYKLTTARERASKLRADANRCQTAVLDVLKTVKDDAVMEDFTEELDDLEEQKIGFEKDLNLFDKLKEYYTKSRKCLDKWNKCSLCDRGFDSSPEQTKYRSKLIQKINAQLDDETKKEILNDLDGVEKSIDTLRAVRPQYEAYEKAESELPNVDKEITAAESQKETLVRRLEEQDKVLRDADEKRQDIESMSKTVMNISQSYREITEAEKQIERMTSQQQSSTGFVRTTDEVNERQATVAEQMKAAKAQLSKLTSDKQRMKDLVSELELERSELKNKLSNAQRQLDRKRDLLDQIQGLKDDRTQQQGIIEQADEDLKDLEPEIDKARTIRDDAVRRGRAKEQKIAEERDGVAHTFSELKMIDNDIQDYIDRGGATKLASIQRAIQTLEQTIHQTERESEQLTALINKQREELANSDRRKKNISDNLNYRRNLRLLDVLSAEIAELESRNADEDYNRLVREARQYEGQYNRLLAERGSLMGSMKTKDEELGSLLGEWEMEYKNAANKYRESHIKVETTKAAIEDLGRYSAALDKAIMQYHSLKMEEVNRIAAELWQATYQGTDIDTISIRSENETATGKRSYNYRVCMVKGDTEMDMRGRCSAGQKVLASIIIRLALAESFGINCGLIALDEPTTNLDSDNIRSLAQSLHSIIQARQAQSNFQLIVITHDEDFLRHMQCSDFCDVFYRVKRDEKQNSVIEKQSITRLID
ncbi:DNA repair protein RAD50 [Pleurostoma richardsiae]|uniref:DNA repair protein RAD50 n=1 Tax=Pleurostoma richardsiae TaxID=41990 RepID=A0AA38RXQ5_9PEZI|nr:DNA repair protein RAD50 [Pleurostoma richardsiae]